MWHTIIGIELAESYLVIAGERASSFPKGIRIRVTGRNAGNYFVTATQESGGNTKIFLDPALFDNEYEGKLRKKKRHPDL